MATISRRLSNEERVKMIRFLPFSRASELRPGACYTQPKKRDRFGNRLSTS
jgi:hypothetical protein